MRARSPQYLIKYGKLVCRGAGDFHLPRSMRARSPHVLFPRQQFQRGTKFREPTGQRITTGDYAGALELDTSSSRHGADWTAPAGDFVLCTTNLRSWIAADAKHLHHTIFIKTANLFAGVQVILTCRSPHVLFPSAVPPLTDEERSSKSRRDTTSPQEKIQMKKTRENIKYQFIAAYSSSAMTYIGFPSRRIPPRTAPPCPPSGQ